MSLGKGLAVVAVALALGIYLMQLGGGKQRVPVAASSPTTTTTTTTAPTTSTSTTAATTAKTAAGAGTTPSAAVKVLVTNASHTSGAASHYSAILTNDGWGALTPVNALTVLSSSMVAYQPGYKADAVVIASELGLPATSVRPNSVAVPAKATQSTDVMVLVGMDLAAKVASNG